MKCPFCGYTESKVVDSRPTDDSERIRRRRECLRGRYVQWKGVDAEGRKEEYLLAKSYMGGAKMEGHLCVECRKVILDIEQF